MSSEAMEQLKGLAEYLLDSLYGYCAEDSTLRENIRLVTKLLAKREAQVRLEEHKLTCGRCALQEGHPKHPDLKCERAAQLEQEANHE